MSNPMPIVPPLFPTDAEDVNAPEPESERAERAKAEKAERIIEDDTVPMVPEDEFPENTVKREQEIAEKRQRGE